MNKTSATHDRHQDMVNVFFQSQSSFWKDVYSGRGVFAEIVQDRHAAVLKWVDRLALEPGARVLEVGCGAGIMAVALAQRGLRVDAIDSSESMVALARRHAAESGTSDLLSPDVGDVCSLAFENDSFDLVVALGVIPWLEQPELALQEMTRVTRPGGHVIFTAGNRAGLSNVFNPQRNWVLRPLGLQIKEALVRARRRDRSPSVTLHSRRMIDAALERAGLEKSQSMTRGFGPFLLFRRPMLPESLGIALHQRLQRLANQNMPLFRSTGSEHIVLATKPKAQHAREGAVGTDGTGICGALPHISVMIPTSNRPRDIERCLRSMEAVNYPSWDLTVVDQSRDDATQRVVEAFVGRLPQFTYRRMAGSGAARGRNLALRIMSGPIVAFLDDDCTVSPNWLEQVAAAFARHPGATMVFGQVFAADHNPGKYFTPFFAPEQEQVLRGRLAFIRVMGIGASMYVRQEATVAAGLFDVHTGAGARFACEDRDLAYRVLRRGGAIVQTPHIQVEHFGALAYANGSASRMLNRAALSQGAMEMKLLRCGELAAIAIIAKRLALYLMGIRPLNILRHRATYAAWPFWYICGLLLSLQYPVNRKECLWANRGQPLPAGIRTQTDQWAG